MTNIHTRESDKAMLILTRKLDVAWSLLEEIALRAKHDAEAFGLEADQLVQSTPGHAVLLLRRDRAERTVARITTLLSGEPDRVDTLAGLALTLVQDLGDMFVHRAPGGGDTWREWFGPEAWSSYDRLRAHLNGKDPAAEYAEMNRAAGFDPADLEPVEALRKVYAEDDVFAPADRPAPEPPKVWDGRSSTLENEQAIGVKAFAERHKGPKSVSVPIDPDPAVVPDPEALGWLQQWVSMDMARLGEKQARPTHDLTEDGDEFTRDVVLQAYVAGRSQSWLLDRMGRALALINEGAELLRQYEAHHTGKMEALVDSGRRDPDTEAAVDDARRKAQRNAQIATRFEDFIKGTKL